MNLRFKADGREPAFLYEPDAKTEVNNVMEILRFNQKEINTQDIRVSTNFLPVNCMDMTHNDGERLAHDMIYQGYRAQDQMRRSIQKILRERKRWLTLDQYIKAEKHMKSITLYEKIKNKKDTNTLKATL